jgi:polyisoprenyl-phosphate glycosyltransferase
MKCSWHFFALCAEMLPDDSVLLLPSFCSSAMAPKYSFIIPIFNEEETLPELYRRLKSVMDEMDGSVEAIFIDDGSKDRSLKMIHDLHVQDDRICYLSFARNFGHQIAVTAGLNFARGSAIIVMDADLQDPPELVPQMAELWKEGFEVIYAQRVLRRKESWLKRSTAYGFYRLLNWLADVDIPTDTGDFCLMDRKVVDALNAIPERNRYIRGLRSWVGFRQTALKFERDSRYAGEVKYTFRKSLSLAINSIIAFSKIPLRLSTYIGLFSAFMAVFMAFLVLYWRLFAPSPHLVGYSIITVAMFFLGAVQLISLGILGEYIGRIYEEVKGRPLYTLREIQGFAEPVSTALFAASREGRH